MSLHLLPALSLGARLDEIERTARELFGSAVTISAETETPYTRSDEEPKPDKAIKVVIKIELPGAFPKLSNEQACPGGRASPAMEIGEPSSRASSSEGACAASSALGPTAFPATTTSSGAPSVSTSESALDRCAREIDDAACGMGTLKWSDPKMDGEDGVSCEVARIAEFVRILGRHFPSQSAASEAVAIVRDEIRAQVAGTDSATITLGNGQLAAMSFHTQSPAVYALAKRILLLQVKLAGGKITQEMASNPFEWRSLHQVAKEHEAASGESAANVSEIVPGGPLGAALQRGPVIPPGTTRLRVRCHRDYVVKRIRLAIVLVWSSLDERALQLVSEAAADASIELLGQDAGTQRAPVKLPDAPPVGWLHSRSWETCLEGVRRALAEAGVDVENEPLDPNAPGSALSIDALEVERWQKHLRARAADCARALKDSSVPDVVRAAETIESRIRALPLGKPENQA